MTAPSTTLSVRLPPKERETLEEAAKARGVKPSVLARDLLMQGLRKEAETSPVIAEEVRALREDVRRLAAAEPHDDRKLASRLAELEQLIERIDVNLYNALVFGVELATGKAKPAEATRWAREHLKGE